MLTSRRDDVTQPESHSGSDVKFRVISTSSDGWLWEHFTILLNSWRVRTEWGDLMIWPKNHIREMNQELVTSAISNRRWTRLSRGLSIAAAIWNVGNISHTMSYSATCKPLVLSWEWRVSKWPCHVEGLIILLMAKCWGSRSLSQAPVFVNISMFQQLSPAEPGSAYERRWQQAAVEEVSPVPGLSRFSGSHWLTKPLIRHGYIQSYIHFDPFDPSDPFDPFTCQHETHEININYNIIQLVGVPNII